MSGVQVVAGVIFFVAPVAMAAAWFGTAWLRARGLIICRTEAKVDLITAPVLIVVWWASAVLSTWGLSWVDSMAAGGQGFILGISLRRWEEHRHHDEDCQFPPRRRRSGGRVRIPRPVIARKSLSPA